MALKFIQQLSLLPQDTLRLLYVIYYVRNREGREYDICNIQNLNEWIKPDNKPFMDDPLQAVISGFRFDNKKNIYSELPKKILKDLSKWPIRGNSKILFNYFKEIDKRKYFETISKEPFDNFLDDRERVFYLTRGFGLPNKSISIEDANIRLQRISRAKEVSDERESNNYPISAIVNNWPELYFHEVVRCLTSFQINIILHAFKQTALYLENNLPLGNLIQVYELDKFLSWDGQVYVPVTIWEAWVRSLKLLKTTISYYINKFSRLYHS
jgi:hypothetical protein